MGFKVKAEPGGSGDYELPPADNHAAVCVVLIDLGTQIDEYKGVKKENKKVAFVWELDAKTEEGEPHRVVAEYTLTLKGDKSKLRKLLAGWRGKPIEDEEEVDITKVVGHPCLINIVHKKTGTGKDFASIETVSRLPKGMVAPVPSLKPFAWEIGMPPFNGDSLPWLFGKPIIDHIKASKEMSGAAALPAQQPPPAAPPASKPQAPPTPVQDDEVPF